jgi:hypothetical protein
LIKGLARERVSVATLRERVEIRDEINAVVRFGKFKRWSKRGEVITEV